MNITDLSTADRIVLNKKIYTDTSYFQKLFKQDWIEKNCDSLVQGFRAQIVRLLLEKNIVKTPLELEKLHTVLSDEMRAYNFNDGVNKISTYFYETDPEFMKVYYQLICFLRKNFLKEPFLFQNTPTIRIHCPKGMNSDHYPRYHTDIGYGHPPEEINLWIPLTKLLSGHGFKIMSLENSKLLLEKFNYDFAEFIRHAIEDQEFSKMCSSLSTPVKIDFGKLMAFDSRCIHSGYPLTEHTRVSIDIRLLPLSQYRKMNITYQGSGRRKILFEPGQCYHELHSDYFLNQDGYL